MVFEVCFDYSNLMGFGMVYDYFAQMDFDVVCQMVYYDLYEFDVGLSLGIDLVVFQKTDLEIHLALLADYYESELRLIGLWLPVELYFDQLLSVLQLVGLWLPVELYFYRFLH